MILGKNRTILGKNSGIFSNIGKVYLLSLDFSANWECSRSIGNFFQPIGKKFGTGNLIQFCIEKKRSIEKPERTETSERTCNYRNAL